MSDASLLQVIKQVALCIMLAALLFNNSIKMANVCLFRTIDVWDNALHLKRLDKKIKKNLFCQYNKLPQSKPEKSFEVSRLKYSGI